MRGKPSLDLAVYKMACIGLMAPADYDLRYSGNRAAVTLLATTGSPIHPFDQFHDDPINGDASTEEGRFLAP